MDEIDLSPTVRRQRRWLLGLALVAVVAVGGVVASFWVKSPAQEAADRAGPPPTMLTAQVERRVLTTSVITQATVAASSSEPVPIVGTSAPGGRLVVSAAPPRAGSTVHAGDRLLEVSGRPLFVLPGPVPLFRDIHAGDSGPDVSELQSALSELGYDNDDDRGTFGAGTQNAVSKFYRAAGYAPIEQAGHVVVPIGEVAMLRRLPAQVTRVSVGLGSVIASTPAEPISLSSGSFTVSGVVPAGQQLLLKQGLAVSIDNDITGDRVPGVLRAVGAYVASNTPAAAGYPVTVVPRASLPLSWLGAQVRLEITAASTGALVLVVPVSAISTDTSGAAGVRVVDRSGTRRVAVRTGAMSGGYVQVEPLNGAALQPGASVVVGS